MKKTFRTLLSFFLVAMIAVSSMNGIAADNTPQEPKTVNVRFTIPTSIATNKNNYTFSIREKGTEEWTEHGLYNTDFGLQVNLNLSVSTDYEYVLNYINSRVHFKVIGNSLMVDSDNEIQHMTDEAGVVETKFIQNETESFWELKQLKNPVEHEYPANRTLMFQVNPEDAILNLKVRDLDGSKLPLELGYFSTLYLPRYKNNIEGSNFNYEINQPGYANAFGTIHYGDAGVSVENVVGHELNYSEPFVRVALEREIRSVDVIFPNIINGTEISATSENEIIELKVENDRVNINLHGENEALVNVKMLLESYETISMHIRVKSDGTFSIQNEDELKTMVKNLSVEENSVNFNQIRRSLITQHNDGSATASFGSLRELFEHEGTVYPGESRSGNFRVVNDSDVRYRLIGAKVNPMLTTINENNMYRTGSDVIRSYYEHFNPDYIIKKESAEFLFDFEAINGISFYDGLLKELQRTNPKLERIEDLEASEIAKIFTNEYTFPTNEWEGNPNAGYAVQIDFNNYAIRETDPKMIELAQYHLFNNALYMSFDTQQTGNLDGVSHNNGDQLKFASYKEHTDANSQMLSQIFNQIGVLEPHSYIDFDNFSYLLAGDLVHDAYRPAYNAFDFSFDLSLGIVGIDGYAFHDSDRDGYQGENETVMAGVELELLSNGVVVASSQTSDSGYYAFPNVDPGNYQIRVKIPENFNITSKVNALLGNRFDASGLSDIVTVVDNENYHYRVGFVSPLPVVNGTVEAEHVLVDETGTIVETLDVETITGKVGSAYSLSPKTNDAYEFVRHEGAPANGSFTVDSQNMTFMYRKKAATLIVNYVDVNGKTIAPTTTLAHKINDTYTVSILDIDGYTYKSIQEGSAPLSGKLGAGDTVVTLVYAQNTGPVIPDAVVLEVNYRDEKGHVIAPQVQTTHDLNSPYVVTPIAIKGYTFKRIDVTSEPLEGTLTKPKTVVTLIYEKNESDKELPNTGVSQSYLGFILVGVGLVIIGMKRRKRETV